MERGLRVWLSVAVAVLFVAGVAAAFTVDDDTSPRHATLGLLERIVEVQPAAAADYTAGRNGQPVNPGDHIRTGTPGFAALNYPDGSITRLGPATEFHVLALTGDAGDRAVRTRLDIGEIWNRVKELSGTETFEVETPVGTAAVRGTTFLIRCDAAGCQFTVTDGTIDVTTTTTTTITVTAGQQLAVDTAGTPNPLTPATLDTDPFAQTNQALDNGATFTPATATTTTAAAPQKTLIVVGGSPIRTVDPDTGAITALAASGENPAWSPDRRRLAYDRGGDIFVADADGRNERAVVTGAADDIHATWNPGGTTIAFARDETSIEVVNVDGSGARQLATLPEANFVEWPEWSPDGTRVAFTRIDSNDNVPRLAFVPATGGTVQRTDVAVFEPDWAPDGGSVVSHGKGNACTFRIERVDLASGTRIEIVPASCSFAWSGRWSPDGRRVAYLGEPPPGQQGPSEGPLGLRVVNADGSGNRLLAGIEGTIDW